MKTQVPGRGTAGELIFVAVPVEHKSLVQPIRALISAAQKARKGLGLFLENTVQATRVSRLLSLKSS